MMSNDPRIVALRMSIAVLMAFCAVALVGPSSSGQSMASDGPLIGEPFAVSSLSIDERAPVVSHNTTDDEFLVAWYNDRPYVDDEIYAQRISASGAFLSWFHVDMPLDGGSPRKPGDRTYPAIAYNSQRNNYLVVYYRWNATSMRWDLYGRRVDRYGPQGDEIVIATSTRSGATYEERPFVAYNGQDDEFLVVWVHEATWQEVWAQRVAGVAAGGTGGTELIGASIQLASSGTGHCTSPAIVYHGGRNEYALVYTRYQPGQPSRLQLARYGADGMLITGTPAIISVDEAGQQSIAVDATADEYLVVYSYTGGASYTEIRSFRSSGSLDSFVPASIVENPSNDAADPDVAFLSGPSQYQIVWSQQHMGGRGIRGMRYSSVPSQAIDFDITMVDGDWEQLSRVAAGSTTSLVVWEHDANGGTGYDIAGQLLGYRQYLPLIVRRS